MKRISLYVLSFCGFILSSITHADGILVAPINKQWSAVLGIAGGAAVTNNLGKKQNFPILNSITDEFYAYSPTNKSQARGLFELFLGTEHQIRSNWMLQGGLVYSQTGSYQSKGNFFQGTDVISADEYHYKYTVLTRELLVQAKLMYPFKERFYPYFLAGIGSSFNQASDYSTNVPPFLTFTRHYTNNTSSSFAYKVGLGIDMDIAQHARLGVAYRFSDQGRVNLGSASIGNISVPGTLSQSTLNTNEIVLQLTYII